MYQHRNTSHSARTNSRTVCTIRPKRVYLFRSRMRMRWDICLAVQLCLAIVCVRNLWPKQILSLSLSIASVRYAHCVFSITNGVASYKLRLIRPMRNVFICKRYDSCQARPSGLKHRRMKIPGSLVGGSWPFCCRRHIACGNSLSFVCAM